MCYSYDRTVKLDAGDVCKCMLLFGKVAYICLFCLIFLTCLNEIPAQPQLCNFPLSNDKLSARPPLTEESTLFFCILCGRGDLPSSTMTYIYVKKHMSNNNCKLPSFQGTNEH